MQFAVHFLGQHMQQDHRVDRRVGAVRVTEAADETAIQFAQIAVGPVHVFQVQRQVGVVPFRQVAAQQEETGGAGQGFRFRAHRQVEQGHGPQEAGVRAVAERAHQPEQ